MSLKVGFSFWCDNAGCDTHTTWAFSIEVATKLAINQGELDLFGNEWHCRRCADKRRKAENLRNRILSELVVEKEATLEGK